MGRGVTVEGLKLERGGWPLFDNLSFEAPRGAHVALTGPNGAGKTSLLRAIAGFLRPVAGAILIDGAPPEEAQGGLHVVGHRDGLKAPLDCRGHLVFWADLLGGHRSMADDALARVGLARVADLPARTLSAGQARRLALARLIVAPRPLWLMDEPAAALDADGKALVESMIAAHCMAGGVVIAAVHEPLGAPAHTVRL